MEPDTPPAATPAAPSQSSRPLHVSAPAVVHIAVRASAIFVVATWIAGMASAEVWTLLDGGPRAEFSRAAFAISSAMALAMAALMWVAAPFIAGFVKRADEEVRKPFDLVDGLMLVVVWMGLGNVMASAASLLRAFFAWIGAGGFRATPEQLPMHWFGESLVSAFASGVVGIAFLFAAGPMARWLARQAAPR